MCALRGRQPGHLNVRAALRHGIPYKGQGSLSAWQALQSVSRFEVFTGAPRSPYAATHLSLWKAGAAYPHQVRRTGLHSAG